MLACAAAGAQAQSVGPRVSGYVTLTSDYRNRGLSQSRGEPSLQVGGDYQHESGFFGGAYAAMVEYWADPERDSSRRSEIVAYAGYNRRLEDWSMAATLGRYAYPGSDFDYDYNELSGSVAFRDRVSYTASYIDDLFGRSASGLNQELGFSLPLASGFEVGATVGRFEADAIDVRYSHWNAGVSKVIARFGVDLRYYDDEYDFEGALGAAGGGEWVISASYGFIAR